MASHLSTIGFDIGSEHEDYVDLMERAAAEARRICVKAGQYLQWHGNAGEERWLHV